MVDDTEAAELAGAFRRTESGEWWDCVPVPELLAVYERSRAWCAIDAAAHASLDRIRAQVLARYGVDVREPRADPAAVAGALAVRAGIEREAAVLDLAEAAQAMAHAGAGGGRAEDGNAAAQFRRGERLYRRADSRRALTARLDPGTVHAVPEPQAGGHWAALAGTEGLGVGGAQGEPVAGAGRIGADGSPGGVEGAIEEHGLDAHMVVEPLEVPQVGGSRGDVGV